jgi:hypothetical protein
LQIYYYLSTREEKVKEKMDFHKKPKGVFSFTLALFATLLLLLITSSSVTVFYSFVYAQKVTSSTTVTQNPAITNDNNTLKLPQVLVVTDNAMGDSQLPLRSSIINGKSANEELTVSESGQGNLDEYFPIVSFHFNTAIEFEERNTVMKHVLIGPIKSYDSSDTVLEEANYWKDVPLDKKVALEIDHPGPHYLIASVQFANGTSGIYSGVLDVNAIGIKPSSDDFVQFKLDGGNAVLGVVKIEQSDTATSKSDPVFQQIASKIICSDLSDNGFEVCDAGEEEAVLEEDNDDNDNDNENNESDDEEVRGDGGKDGKYDINNCTGEQCEDADRETEQEQGDDGLPNYVPPTNVEGDEDDNTENEDEEE